MFFPYFFSVGRLLKTLFAPWKNLKAKKTIRGFSFGEYFGRLSFNWISRFIGFIMRFSIIVFFLFFMVFYMASVPIIIILAFIFYPFAVMKNSVVQSEAEQHEEMKTQFLASHMLNKEYAPSVEKWFDYLYESHFKHIPWWKMSQLFSTPPLARDWAVGYTPTLDEYTEDLTKTSYQMRIRDHIIGREKESALIERVFSQSEEANAILVGDKGVGKHTIIDLFVKKVYEGTTNSLLAYKRVLKLDMEKILTKYTDAKQREEFLEMLFKEAAETKNVILLIDTIERYISSGEGHVDLSSVIDKFAQTSYVQFLGITTPFQYEKFIYPNEAIRSQFSKIDVEEISKEKAFTIMLDQTIQFEKKFKVTIPYETVIAVIDKSNYYITTIPFPEKALQLLDWTCVYTVQTLKREIITPDIIDTVIASRTNVPTTITDSVKQKLLHMEELLKTKILGQDAAIKEVSATIRRSYLLMGKRKKPIASFLFLGPTGVGKTETAKVISEVFFGKNNEMIRFDMSLYQTKQDIAKLIGSIETLNPGLMTNAIRENPYTVLLIDEIEKANKDLLNIFLTILDEGYFSDGYGQKVDCKNLIIIATSNAGAADMQQLLIKNSLAQAEGDSTNIIMDYLIEKGLFSPEFLNRFDGVVAYNQIGDDSALTLAKNIVEAINNEMYSMHKIHITVSDETLKKLIEKGYNSQFGARNLERVMRQFIEDGAAKLILEGKTQPEQVIHF
jgi:ATP-dependent Clp protease ATP-binding subunit ClpA